MGGPPRVHGTAAERGRVRRRSPSGPILAALGYGRRPPSHAAEASTTGTRVPLLRRRVGRARGARRPLGPVYALPRAPAALHAGGRAYRRLFITRPLGPAPERLRPRPALARRGILPLMNPRRRRSCDVEASRGGAAAATWIVRGDESRRRRGCDVDSPRRRIAAVPRLPRGIVRGGECRGGGRDRRARPRYDGGPLVFLHHIFGVLGYVHVYAYEKMIMIYVVRAPASNFSALGISTSRPRPAPPRAPGGISSWRPRRRRERPEE